MQNSIKIYPFRNIIHILLENWGIRRSRLLFLAPSQEQPQLVYEQGKGWRQKTSFKMVLAGLRIFFTLRGLDWVRLLLGRPTSSLPSKYLTSPTSAMFEIRTSARGAPSSTKEKATSSTSNQRSWVFSPICSTTPPSHRMPSKPRSRSWNTPQWTPMGQRQSPGKYHRSKKQLSSASKCSFRRSCTAWKEDLAWISAHSTFWWLVWTPLRQAENLPGQTTGPLSTSSVSWKSCKHKHQNHPVKNVLHIK